MKLKKVLASVLAAATVLSSAACVNAEETISLTLWGAEEDQTLLAELVENFKAAYPDFTFDIQIGVESESTAKDTVLTDVEAAADVFAFADDQLNDLVSAGALSSLNEVGEALQVAGKSLDDVKAANDAGAVAATMIGDQMYAFPMTGGNTFFLYYDSSVISAEDAASWDTLLAAAEAAGKKVGMTLASGWYNASFFYGAGFTTGLNEDQTTAIDWNGTSADGYTGVDVVKSMLNIAGNSAFMAIADGDISNWIAAGGLCAAISGDWDASAAQEAFGDGYAATKLPTFTIGEDQVQQAPPYGYKFVGVNAYAENVGWAVVLADFLTNEEAQAARFEARGLAPTNLNVQASDEVQSNVAIAAAASESEFGVLQRVGGKYWDPAQTFGEMIAQGSLKADDDAGIQAALDSLVEGVTAPIG
ncbi:MAG: extracellular solute-binding protein [Eubacteriales bacterium]|nr:extracellular solute-binding protein [Eubacteriales bacterium]